MVINNSFNPLVSVVITTHNRLKGLKKAVDSVKKQTYSPIEIIVVDDASNDSTLKYGKTLINQGIKYIRISPENSKGGNYARNIGIKHSTGKYLALLDDDDYWFPNKTELQVKCLESFKDCQLVYCGFEARYDNKIFNYRKLPNPDAHGNLLKKQMYTMPYFNTSELMVTRNLINQVGGFDEQLGYWQEYELYLRLIEKTNVEFVNKPLVAINRSYSQKNRLTNKFENWLDAVDYIDKKHSNLFKLLTKEKQQERKELFYKEAAYRAYMNLNKKEMKKYYLLAFRISPKLEYFVRGKLGISRKDTLWLESMIMKIKYQKDRLRSVKDN